jgi:hypothetical protein
MALFLNAINTRDRCAKFFGKGVTWRSPFLKVPTTELAFGKPPANGNQVVKERLSVKMTN